MDMHDLGLHMVGGIGGGGVKLKSLQRGVTSLNSLASSSVAITTVDLSKAVLFLSNSNGYNSGRSQGQGINYGVYGVLSASSIALYDPGQYGSENIAKGIVWQVAELEGLKSVQRGVTTCNVTNATTTASITSVDRSKSILVVSASNGYCPGASGDLMNIGGYAELSVNNLITFTSPSAYGVAGLYFSWQVLEFK